MTDDDRFRLPRAVEPVRYELTLEPDLDAATFSGSEAVAVRIVEPTDEITLNAVELDITDVRVELSDGTELDATVTLDAEAERATFALSGTAPAGDAVVHLGFSGVLNDKLKGFYRSTFTDPDGAERTIATTQFEATDARRAFPCWDEPDRKAVFAVTLVVDDGLLAVSNAAEVASVPAGEGRRAVTFADTMVMSTYLVAFVVGPLEATEAVDVDGTPLRVVHPPGKGHLTGYALEVGAFALRYFSDYYDMAYPGDKCDLVAIPDFAFGAMENLGCITFREVLLLVDPERSSQPELANVADVISHELAHMWFGDLVTMRWWNGIWLNEAFATFMEMAAVDAFRPAWERWVSFGVSRSGAFDTDSLAATRPVEYPVVSPADAEGMFDVLTYEKGAAVVRMLEQYLGTERFRAGIRAYLATHRHGNTETTDLWDAVEETTGEPTRRIMDTWIFQGGHPVVSVDLDAGGRVLRLAQERFRYTAAAAEGDGATGGERWAVPLLVGWGDDGGGRDGEGASSAAVERLLLDGDTLAVDLPAPASWVVANRGGSGFYRVRYSPELLAAITARAQAELEPLERYGLVDDTWASVLAGTTPATDFVALAQGFSGEGDLSVWQRIVGGLAALDRVLDEPGDRARFAAVVRDLLGPAFERLGDEPRSDEPERTSTLRATLFEARGVLGDDPGARRRAEGLLAASADAERDGNAVDPALLAAAVRVVAHHGDTATFDELLARSRAATTPQDELRYLGALADLPGTEEANRFCELVRSGDVRAQDGPFLLRRALHNRSTGPHVWSFVAREWDALTERFPSNSIARMLEGIRSLSTPALATEVRAFLADHPVPQGAKTLDQHLERQAVNVALREREGERLSAHLRAEQA